MASTHPYHVRVGGRYAGMVFAERCVLMGDSYRLSTDGLPFAYLERNQGIEVVPEPGSKAPPITIETGEPEK